MINPKKNPNIVSKLPRPVNRTAFLIPLLIIKIKNITFSGNEIFGDFKLKSKLKKTKKKFPLRFWKKSKLIESDYEADKENLISFYKEKGYRDARVEFDTIIINDEKTIDIALNIDEGNKYYFGDINYLGNS